jgi:hypothetical protein
MIDPPFGLIFRSLARQRLSDALSEADPFWLW